MCKLLQFYANNYGCINRGTLVEKVVLTWLHCDANNMKHTGGDIVMVFCGIIVS